ncbi:MAG: alkaline phosphatase [Desulfobacteraceae bacterium]|nr:alkaline phosphatase [Desulfobacteraceae bacterium]
MKTFQKRAFLIVLAGFLLSFQAPGAFGDDSGTAPPRKARNVIFMVPDGLGQANVTAARIFKNGLDGPPLNMELRTIGYQRNHSADSMITDSAAAASAWACGEKFRNREICFHAPSGRHKDSLLEIAGKKGKSTGLITNSEITDATPAAFGAHVPTRKCPKEIARQYVSVTGVDVLLGGGGSKFQSELPDQCGAYGDFLSLAISKGYAHVADRAELEKAVSAGKTKILGLFADSDLDFAVDRQHAEFEPSLSEMTASALRVLQKDPDGFFLMIEGSLIDKSNHKRDVQSQIMETLIFDEAVGTVLEWIKADPIRKEETLLIISPDHDTSGFAIIGPYKTLPRKGNVVVDGWVSDRHVASDPMVWSQGPGSLDLSGPAFDNTHIYKVVRDAMQ